MQYSMRIECITRKKTNKKITTTALRMTTLPPCSPPAAPPARHSAASVFAPPQTMTLQLALESSFYGHVSQCFTSVCLSRISSCQLLVCLVIFSSSQTFIYSNFKTFIWRIVSGHLMVIRSFNIFTLFLQYFNTIMKYNGVI